MAATKQPAVTLTLDTDNTTRGFVPTTQLTKLGKEQDPTAAATRVKSLIVFYTQGDPAIREHLRRVHNAEVTEVQLAKQGTEAQQIRAEAGSFSDLEALAQEIWDRVDRLPTCDSNEIVDLAAEVFVREKAMRAGLKAYAEAMNLNIE